MQPLTHLAIRLSDRTYELRDTVMRHTLVSCRHGAVWLPGKVRQDKWGKPDRALTPKLVATLNEQIAAGHPAPIGVSLPHRPGSR